jgi:hypothetical protein
VTIHSQSQTITRTLRTGAKRALTLNVPLGPSDTVQEYTDAQPPAASPGTTVYTTDVTIRPVRGPDKKRR